jgi:hypothetical protein
MHSFFDNTFLAARGNKEWFDILVPLAIAAIYIIVSVLRKKGETQQGGGEAEKPHPRPVDQSARQTQSRRSSYNSPENPVVIRQTALREYDAAKKIARQQFDDRMERIREYEENKPAGVPDEVWKKQIDNARKTVQNEYQNSQQQAQEEYQRVLSRLPTAPSPPARKIQKTQPNQQPVIAKQPTMARPVAYEQAAPQEKSFRHETTAPISNAHRAEPTKVLAYHLSFTKDDLTRGILYSEILGKPLALRDDV